MINARRAIAAAGAAGALTVGVLAGQAADGTALAQAAPTPGHSVSYECGSAYYMNSDGVCTPSPDAGPSGIKCKDGTYSHAANRQGACSHHGGIDDSAAATDESGSAAVGSAALGVGIVGSATLGSSLLPALLFAS